jgi:hypothetical protein
MKKLLAFAFAIGVGLSANAVQAMPLAPDPAPSGMIIKVAGGCGIGFHRGPYGGCRRNGYYGGVYFGAPAVVVAPAPVYGAPPGAPVGPGPYPCGGRGQHRVCGPNGCWMACN